MFSDLALRKRFAFLHSYPSVALAVSGGSDSLALLYLIAQWHDSLTSQPLSSEEDETELHHHQAEQLGASGAKSKSLPDIHVLTVDHGLRAAAQQETDFVMTQAAALGFTAQRLIWHGEKPQTGLQEAARAARYQLCSDYCRRHNIEIMLTAHQKEDQAETFLMRLARGAGVEGLSAMAMQSRLYGLTVARPLLDVSRAQLVTYLSDHGKTWIEDPSNVNTDFERIKIRQNMAALEALNISAEDIARAAFRLNRARDALSIMTRNVYDSEVEFHPIPVFFFKQDVLYGQAEEIVLRLFQMIFDRMSCGRAVPELKQVEVLVTGLRQNRFKKSCLAGCEIMVSGGGVYIYREHGRYSERYEKKIVSYGKMINWGDCFEVTLLKPLAGPIYVQALGTENYAKFRKVVSQDIRLAHFVRKMPSAVGSTLLSFWCHEKLVAVPNIGYFSNRYASEAFAITSLLATKIESES